MTQIDFNKQVKEYQSDIDFYGKEVDDASYDGDYNRLHSYHRLREEIKKDLRVFKSKYPEYVL